jgi:hypothetical protein
MSSNVLSTTGGLFQLPSVGIASSVLPTFQPGLRAARKAEAVIDVKDELEGQVTPVALPVLFPVLYVLVSLYHRRHVF